MDDKPQEPKQNIGQIEITPIVDEMQTSYLAYAMSVIVARALPDIRDGLKPVQRRIIYAMHQMGYHHSGRFQKCASVVGETMKNYHPHGDIPIYDALVRMGQDFSMRYMLIDPQGNFGCFTKDTKVTLADGRNLSFKELVSEQKEGKTHYGFSFNTDNQKIEITELKNARLTHKHVQLLEVHLDNGEKIRCTPNHRFLLKNGTYKEARNLKQGTSLMPAYFNTRQIKVKKGHLRYLSILQPFSNKYEFVHKLADNYNVSNNLHNKIYKSYILHHKDFNRWNNSPNNIIRLTWKQHYDIHYEQVSTLWERKGSEFREKHKQSLKRAFSSSKVRKELSIRSKLLWLDPIYRAKYPQDHFKTMAKKLWDNPNTKTFHKIKMLRQQQDPDFVIKQLRGRKLGIQIRMQMNPYLMKELAQKAAIVLHQKWQNPEYKNKVMKSKILRYSSSILQKYGKITPDIYEKERTNNGIPSLTKALMYFSNFTNIKKQAQIYNHKVSKIVYLNRKADVYDLTTDPWHNFLLAAGIFVHNSQDGDPAAASRYTETRLALISEDLLRDINKGTVDFIDNYSGSTQEPEVLPSVIPALLLNGVSGIAVGYATQIPPHNLGEVTDALIHMIDKAILPDKKLKTIEKVVLDAETSPTDELKKEVLFGEEEQQKDIFHSDLTVEDLMQFIKGPDFPTGASIYDQSEILAAYATGKGRIVMRAKADIEETKSGRFDIIVTELPYQVNKAVLIAKIAELVKDKKIEGISDLRDESDRRGMRIAIELKRDAKPQSILNNLYKHTSMQSVFNVNMIALSDGVPHLMTLKRILEEFIHHRQVVIRRRAEFELREAQARAHILEGLKIAVDNIDEVIAIIRKSANADEARTRLMSKFSLTAIQATAILDMQLRKLAALERQRLEDELKEVMKNIAYLEDLLAHPEKILKVAKEELIQIREKYADERKTRVYKSKVGEFSEEDLVADETTIVTVTKGGYVKRQPPMSFRTQNRGGKGVSGITTKDEDAVSHIFYTKTLDNLLFFTDRGRVFQIKVWEIPEVSRTAKGQAIVNLINVEQGEKITAILTSRKEDHVKFLFMCTREGNVKKTSIEEYANIRKNGLISIKLDAGDELCWVVPTKGSDSLIVVSRKGQSIRFHEKDVRPTHRDTSGVRGISLKGDTVVSMNLATDPKAELLVVMENGMGKKTRMEMWKVQGRGGSGIKAADVTDKTGEIVTAKIVDKDDDTLVLTSNKGQLIKLNLKDVPTLQRQTQGVRLMRMKEDERVAAATVVSSKDKASDNENPDEAAVVKISDPELTEELE